MKSYGDLVIRLHGVSPGEFGDRAEAACGGGWARDRSKDEEMKSAGGGTWFTFTLTGQANLPPAFLFVTDRDAGTLYVPNVIAPRRDRLTRDEYNGILTSFHDRVLANVLPPGTIDAKLGNTAIDLPTSLPREVFRRLDAFSNAANKKTGSGHPFDRERWLDFLIAAVSENVLLDSETLARWLVEEAGWDAEQASRLAAEYEFGRELLERKRAS